MSRGLNDSRGQGHTLILEEVAHARPARKHELCDVLDDLVLRLGRHRLEPFGETDFACKESRVGNGCELIRVGLLTLARYKKNVVDHHAVELSQFRN